MDSVSYWKKRYNTSNIKGASGFGSVGKLLEFKTSFLNKAFKEYGIETVLDFGHGDLGLAEGLDVKSYIGLDIFDYPEKPKDNITLINTPFDKYDGESCDAAICIDVLYHLLENEQDYMKRTLDIMFNKSSNLIIIYAQDSINSPSKFGSGKHLFDSKWRQYLEETYGDKLELVDYQKKPEPYSSAQFFVYKHKR